MVLRSFRLGALALVMAVVATFVVSPPADAKQPAAPLFANYYAQPSGGADVGAQLYLSPRPTPPMVGHTWVTYQPLMPHEFLYPHHRCYVQRHPDARPTRTCVTWRHAVLPNMVPRAIDGKILTHLFND
ncbi:MAG: hypothetical protein JW809_17125 [Pirellulales bacterium]|nr:hypothetical protein [Pirellulales bacterium]